MTLCATCGIAIDGAQDPTRSEARVLGFVRTFHGDHARFPTYREIRGALGYLSIRAVHYHVHQLEQKGWLAIGRPPAHARGIRSVRAAT